MSSLASLACTVCALGGPSKLLWLMPVMVIAPYLVALAVYRLARRFSP